MTNLIFIVCQVGKGSFCFWAGTGDPFPAEIPSKYVEPQVCELGLTFFQFLAVIKHIHTHIPLTFMWLGSIGLSLRDWVSPP